MSDRGQSEPPFDEPVIGAASPPPPRAFDEPDDDGPVIGAPPPAAPSVEYVEADAYEPYPYDDAYVEYDEDGYPVGADYGIPERAPTRQPVFYLFIGLSLVLGGVLVFLLFSLVGGDGDDDPGSVLQIEVVIESPAAGERVDVGREFDVVVSAAATETLARFELLIDDRVVDQEFLTEPAEDGVYRGVLSARFDEVGEYEIIVRAVGASGAEVSSEAIALVARAGVDGERPVAVSGRVVATVNMRAGPGESFALRGTLDPGESVSVIGKTQDLDWLLLDRDGGAWVRRTAVELDDSLDLVSIWRPTPTPVPEESPTEEPSPSATASPSPSPVTEAPDFIATNAELIEGGNRLRVTVRNVATVEYSGPLVIAVANVPAQAPERVANVNLPANGSATIEFALTEPVTEEGTVDVSVDPGNAIEESNEDNNTTNFVLAPPDEPPALTLTPSVEGITMSVLIANSGGPIATTNAEIRVSVGTDTITRTISLALGEGESLTVTNLTIPGSSNNIVIQLFADGSLLAETEVPNPLAGGEETPEPEPTPEE